MIGTVIAILAVSLITLYVIAIFVYDHHRMKKGQPSLFLDVCESEGKGKRLVRAYRKANSR